MNGYQQKQVTRALTQEPTYALKDWEKSFLAGLKRNFWDRDLSTGQNSKLNEIMRKYE